MTARTPLILASVALLLAACTAAPAATTSSPPGSAAVTATGSSGPDDGATPDPTSAAPSSAAPASAQAVVTRVGDAQWARIVAAGMARTGCPLGQSDLRRVEVNHWTFDGAVQRGVLVVNKDVAADVAAVFTALYEARYPIRQMRPLEEFGGDNEKSMAADNTAAFNCRTAAQTNAPIALSPHANGRAIDINPVENPWQDPRCTPCWSPVDTYGTTRAGPGVVTEGDVVWTAFTQQGWTWQDIKVKDYMHFDTGYPSVAWDAAKGRPSPTPTPTVSPSASGTTSAGASPSSSG